MARLTSIEKGGFYPYPEEHLPAMTSLFAPAPQAGRLLDPCAGEGKALTFLADAWQLTPYANELDTERAALCKTQFGPTQTTQGDLFQLRAPGNSFVAAWVNPPYTWDTTSKTRRELRMLKHSLKWIQPGGYALWVVYAHHVSKDAALFLAKHCRQVDVWGVPGLHLGEYTQVVVVAKIGPPPEERDTFALRILEQAQSPQDLVPQPEPRYTFPTPRQLRRTFYFAPKVLTPDIILAVTREDGTQLSATFQETLKPAPEETVVQPLAQPARGQLALILASGLFNGIVLDLPDGKRAAVRSKVTSEERLEEQRTEGDGDAETTIEREVYRTTPRVSINMLDENGAITAINSDEGLVGFIQGHKPQLLAYLDANFKPRYNFDPDPEIVPLLNAARIRKGHQTFPLWETQKHVIAACYRSLQQRQGMFLVGEPGIGKTALATVLAFAMQPRMKAGQVVVITCPPHLVKKWQREIEGIAASLGKACHVAILRRSEEVSAFMRRAKSAEQDVLHFALISREAAKLGEGWESAVLWKQQRIVRWRPGEAPPEEYEGQPRILSYEMPLCPTCGQVVERVMNGETRTATRRYLERGKRKCLACESLVWQEKRTFSAPKNGQKYPPKNPRVPLADFIARRYSNRVHLYVNDEIHEAKSSGSGQGQAMMTLARTAEKVIGLTGTLFGGKASDLYDLEFTLNRRVRHKYPWGAGGRNSWVKTMGVLERAVEYRPQHDEHGRYTGKRRIERRPEEAPGCSPELVKEIIDHTLFVGLLDTGRPMPPFEEITVPIELDGDMAGLYDEAKETLGKYLFQCRLEGDSTFSGAYLQGLLSWPTAVFRPEVFIHRKRLDPEADEFLEYEVHTLPGLGTERIYPKEAWLIEILNEELEQGRKVAVYVRQTGTRDIQPRLQQLIERHVPLAKPWIMYSGKVSAQKREERLGRELARGVNVLLCNPNMVKTGLDLVDFPTILFYEIDYSLFTVVQASRRAWRIIQDQPCKVYYPFYTETMEERAVTLVGKKQAAAGLLAGQGTGGGLSAFTGGMGGNGNLLAELAADFNGQSKTQDVAALFDQETTTVNRADSTWLSGIDAHPEVFVAAETEPIPAIPGDPLAAFMVTEFDARVVDDRQVAHETDELAMLDQSEERPVLPTPLLPPRKKQQQRRKKQRRRRKVDLAAAPGDDAETPILVPDWPRREEETEQVPATRQKTAQREPAQMSLF